MADPNERTREIRERWLFKQAESPLVADIQMDIRWLLDRVEELESDLEHAIECNDDEHEMCGIVNGSLRAELEEATGKTYAPRGPELFAELQRYREIVGRVTDKMLDAIMENDMIAENEGLGRDTTHVIELLSALRTTLVEGTDTE